MTIFPSSSYALGIFFLTIVSLLWTVCSVVVQHLYNDMQFDSPFLIVYIGTSLFSIFLPVRLGYERWGHELMRRYCCKICGGGDSDNYEANEVVIIPWRKYMNEVGEDATGLMSTSSRHNDVSVNSSDTDIHNFIYEPTIRNNQNILSHQDHISMSAKVAPIWFLSNYFYAVSLEWTSIANSTVLASMGSVFAFGFATCSRFGDEKVTKWKILGVALCFMGGAATAWTDVSAGGNNDGESDGGDEDLRHLRYLRRNTAISDFVKDSSLESLMGDLAGFVSAIGYGAYTVLLRHLCPKDEDRMSMQLLFGYIGLLNMTILLPVAIWVIVSSYNDNDSQSEPSEGESPSSNTYEDGTSNVHATLTWSIFLFLLLKGLLDNVISDYLWARAVILTSATVASVGVGLTIPMAFFADWVMGNGNGTQLVDVLGALSVLLGFVFVNLNGEKEEREQESHESDSAIDMKSVVHDVEILS